MMINDPSKAPGTQKCLTPWLCSNLVLSYLTRPEELTDLSHLLLRYILLISIKNFMFE